MDKQEEFTIQHLKILRDRIKSNKITETEEILKIYKNIYSTCNPRLLGELFQTAIFYGNLEHVKQIMSIEKFDIANPPCKLTYNEKEKIKLDSIFSYQFAPYIIQAANRGHNEIVDVLLLNNRSLDEEGHICFSPKRRNSVISNVLGSACYHRNFNLVNKIISNLSIRKCNIEFLSYEQKEKHENICKIEPEMSGFSPLLLAIAGGDSQIVEFLINNDFNVKIKSSLEDNLLHIAAHFESIKVLEVLSKLYPQMLTEINLKGETPLHKSFKSKSQNIREFALNYVATYPAFQYIVEESKEKDISEKKALKSKKRKDKKMKKRIMKTSKINDEFKGESSKSTLKNNPLINNEDIPSIIENEIRKNNMILKTDEINSITSNSIKSTAEIKTVWIKVGDRKFQECVEINQKIIKLNSFKLEPISKSSLECQTEILMNDISIQTDKNLTLSVMLGTTTKANKIVQNEMINMDNNEMNYYKHANLEISLRDLAMKINEIEYKNLRLNGQIYKLSTNITKKKGIKKTKFLSHKEIEELLDLVNEELKVKEEELFILNLKMVGIDFSILQNKTINELSIISKIIKRKIEIISDAINSI